MQKYPTQVADVFDGLKAHVASLHGMIEHGDAFAATEEELRKADENVSTWAYTAEKNLAPFVAAELYDSTSLRFNKMPNGIPTREVRPVPRSFMNMPEDAFVLCCVSRAIPDKGWAETIMAVQRARELTGRDIRLVLVGNGLVYDEYCQNSPPDFVCLTGFSENSLGYYSASDMGIMLTKFKSESFPLTIVDALFAGKPYIATDVGDIKNMLTSENGDVAGQVVKLENWEVPIEAVAAAIATFATDSKVYAQAQGLVAEVAKRYRIEDVAAKYIQLFVRDCGAHRAEREFKPVADGCYKSDPVRSISENGN